MDEFKIFRLDVLFDRLLETRWRDVGVSSPVTVVARDECHARNFAMQWVQVTRDIIPGPRIPDENFWLDKNLVSCTDITIESPTIDKYGPRIVDSKEYDDEKETPRKIS